MKKTKSLENDMTLEDLLEEIKKIKDINIMRAKLLKLYRVHKINMEYMSAKIWLSYRAENPKSSISEIGQYVTTKMTKEQLDLISIRYELDLLENNMTDENILTDIKNMINRSKSNECYEI